MKLRQKPRKHKKVISPKHLKLLSRLQKANSERKLNTKKRLMATPIKKSVDRHAIKGKFGRFSGYIGKNIFRVGGVVFALTLVYFLFFSPVFKISSLDITPPSAFACIKEDDITNSLLKHKPYIWQYPFIDTSKFLNKHPCLRSLSILWSPLQFNTFHVRLATMRPILKVAVQMIDRNESSIRQDDIHTGHVIKESILYSSANGALFSLEQELNPLSMRYKIKKDHSVTHLTQKYLTFIFQLDGYLRKEFSYEPQIEGVEGGSVRTSFPNDTSVYLTERQPLDVQLSSLQAVLKQSTINKAKIETIDLRFGNPIVRFKK